MTFNTCFCALLFNLDLLLWLKCPHWTKLFEICVIFVFIFKLCKNKNKFPLYGKLFAIFYLFVSLSRHLRHLLSLWKKDWKKHTRNTHESQKIWCVFYLLFKPSIKQTKSRLSCYIWWYEMPIIWNDGSTLRETSAFPVFFLFLTRKLVNKFKVDPLDDVKKNTPFAENLVL